MPLGKFCDTVNNQFYFVQLLFVAPVGYIIGPICMGKSHLKIRYHKKGLCLEKDCVMNMTVLRHEYKGGCILTFLWGRGGAI